MLKGYNLDLYIYFYRQNCYKNESQQALGHCYYQRQPFHDIFVQEASHELHNWPIILVNFGVFPPTTTCKI